jgi:YVTN family beta-propeller protein
MYLNRSKYSPCVAVLAVVLGLVGAVLASPVVAGTFAYVVVGGPSSGLSVIDTHTQKLVETIPLGSVPSDVAVAPDGKRVYALAGGLLVIDATTNKTITTIPLGGSASHGFTMSLDGKRIYVPLTSPSQDTGQVAVIDTALNKVVTRISLGQCPDARAAITPDGRHLYLLTTQDCPSSLTSTVTVIDTIARRVIATVPLRFRFAHISITPDGKRAYVGGHGPVQVIDTASNRVVTEVQNPFADLTGVQGFTLDGKHLYISNVPSYLGPCTISDLDTRANKIQSQVVIPDRFFCAIDSFAFTPHATRGYIPALAYLDPVATRTREVAVFDTATDKVIDQIRIGLPPRTGPGSPGNLALTPNGKLAYTTAPGESSVMDSVWAIDTTTNSVIAKIPVPGIAGQIAITPPTLLHFSNARLWLRFGRGHDRDYFGFMSFISLNRDGNGIDPVKEPVTIQIGAYRKTIPAGSFKRTRYGRFEFHGVIDGIYLDASIERTGRETYFLAVRTWQANLKGTEYPVPVALVIGDDSGTVSVKPFVLHDILAKKP